MNKNNEILGLLRTKITKIAETFVTRIIYSFASENCPRKIQPGKAVLDWSAGSTSGEVVRTSGCQLTCLSPTQREASWAWVTGERGGGWDRRGSREESRESTDSGVWWRGADILE